MSYHLVAAAFSIFSLFFWHWRRARRSIAYLVGPPSDSWLVGNMPSFVRAENAGEADFKWTEKYGTAFCFKGCFGEDILYISDPKALQHIMNKSSYNYPKTSEARTRIRISSGPGISAVEGAQHARQRRIMLPSFSHSVLKGFLPLFVDLSRKTTSSWKAKIHELNTEETVIDVASLLSRTTLDAIGEAAFGYTFDAIDSSAPKTELHKAYKNFFNDTGYMPSNWDIAFINLLGSVPAWLFDILTSLPKKDIDRLRNYKKVSYSVAKDFVKREMHAQENGKEAGKDVMSVLIKANNAEDPKRRLEEEEILPQITTLLLAGHETTANTLSWMLYEISRHPEVQRKLRSEVQAIWTNVVSRGDTEITLLDMESMKYMIAVMKETLRYHPVALQTSRRARRDDVIPLEIPKRTVSGDEITAIPVRKGQRVTLAFASYNRLKTVWGEDADQWRPERFLEEHPNEQKTSLGVYANLASFGSGVRNCIGWRFAVLEIQTVLIELIHNFEFSPAPGVEIKRAISGIMQSMVKGQEHKGTQLPLKVSIISERDAD